MAALRDYAGTPVHVQPLKSEALVRLLIADLVGEGVTRASLGTLRADLDDLFERLELAEASAENLPHRRKYLRLAHAFMRRFLELHRELIEAVEGELGAGGGSEATDAPAGEPPPA